MGGREERRGERRKMYSVVKTTFKENKYKGWEIKRIDTSFVSLGVKFFQVQILATNFSGFVLFGGLLFGRFYISFHSISKTKYLVVYVYWSMEERELLLWWHN